LPLFLLLVVYKSHLFSLPFAIKTEDISILLDTDYHFLAIKAVIKENSADKAWRVMKSIKTICIAIFTIMVILITVSPGLCAGKKQQVSKEDTIPTDSGKTIQCNVNSTFSIVLDSNPTTGYRWQLASSQNGALLKLIGSQYRAPETELAGAGGEEIWSFKALSVGQTTIIFEYMRPWEKGKEPIKRTVFTVHIQ